MNELIRLEIERGDEALKSAELLLAAGLQRDAMSRTCYAVLHYARALLATKSLSPKSHQGVLQVFSQHFVKTGLVGAPTRGQVSTFKSANKGSGLNIQQYPDRPQHLLYFQRQQGVRSQHSTIP